MVPSTLLESVDSINYIYLYILDLRSISRQQLLYYLRAHQ